MTMAIDPRPPLRERCLALPEAHEVVAWQEPTFRVRNKMFAMYASAGTHHGGGRPAVWIKSSPINQRLLIDSDARRYFSPPYVGPSGWVGVWLDKRPRWGEVDDLLKSGYRLVAPKRLIALLPE
jgi:predicted DNA-binding protein (MmcQ/YjbR family)